MSNSFDAFKYLARVVFCGPVEGKRMILVAPYVDESGTHATAPILALAGYVSTVDKWGAFSSTWNNILEDLKPWQSPKQDYFHMQKFAGNFAPYEKFKHYPKEKDEFAVRIITAIKEVREFGFAAALRIADYDAVVCPSLQLQLGSAYTFCVEHCLAAVVDWANAYEANTKEHIAPIIYTFEDGAAHEKEARAFLSLIRDKPEDVRRYRYLNHAFVPKRGTPPLQAADVYACETYRHIARERTGVIARGDYYLDRLLDDQHECRFMDRGEIEERLRDTLEHITRP